MITQIDTVNLSHYDLGFTDHAIVYRKLPTRWLDRAIDLASDSSSQFSWTVEAANAILD